MSEHFSEKAHFKHKEKCKLFIKKNFEVKNNHEVGKKALKLCHKLMGSMLRSQRFFDWRIKLEVEFINSLESEMAKEIAIANFRQKDILLLLDSDAHEVFDNLQIIIKNNI